MSVGIVGATAGCILASMLCLFTCTMPAHAGAILCPSQCIATHLQLPSCLVCMAYPFLKISVRFSLVPIACTGFIWGKLHAYMCML